MSKNFGIREVCDVVFKAKAKQSVGSKTFYKDEPVLYFSSLKTSTIEGTANTVYAQGGKGNPRLVAWEGDKAITFNMEDALLSAESLAILTGADLIDAGVATPIYVHQTSQVEVLTNNTIVLTDIEVEVTEDVFIMFLDDEGYITGEPCVPASTPVVAAGDTTITCYSHDGLLEAGTVVLVDYYIKKTADAQQIEITAEKFGGNFYIEGSTLFRTNKGQDLPAEFIIPNGKVQTNFTFTMAASGDPSTFAFTVDAFPDYTKFDLTKKVLSVIQIIDEASATEESREACVSV